ncbi:SH3 domain-containing C40 family peptidase [Paenibacillus sp. GD4]|jgi:peptidoglycan DL-endopeptidase CwlO|uniref:C40 family peptidase n=1 Tax=Paenibacillus sp. GD4 TaxID=3068890 RepID=UPI0027968A8C|nr:SH3 domain-containing C40 family peptidase [Paenibacillus sp. GD4]MDQ1912832.1 SH3 domain-containing C40 family peptidase [Paenibacillus sp. GD4]
MKKQLASLLVLLFIVLSLGSAVQAEETVPTKAQAVAGVSFRDQPSTSSQVMRYLKTGEVVTVLDVVNPYWYRIQDQQGTMGYVSSSSKYITLISNAKIIYGVNFRTGPSTEASKIRMLSTGEEVLVLEKINDSWYKAKDKNGVVGYLSSSSKYITANFSVTAVVLPLQERIESIIQAASAYTGTPYEFGSERFDTATFDCSDLVQQAFWDATRTVVPGDSRAQGDYVKQGAVTSDWRQLKRGDLMFFMSYNGSSASDYSGIDKTAETITHVAIYLGDGMMLHTYSPESGGVRTDSIAGRHWEYRFLFGGSATN